MAALDEIELSPPHPAIESSEQSGSRSEEAMPGSSEVVQSSGDSSSQLDALFSAANALSRYACHSLSLERANHMLTGPRPLTIRILPSAEEDIYLVL